MGRLGNSASKRVPSWSTKAWPRAKARARRGRDESAPARVLRASSCFISKAMRTSSRMCADAARTLASSSPCQASIVGEPIPRAGDAWSSNGPPSSVSRGQYDDCGQPLGLQELAAKRRGVSAGLGQQLQAEDAVAALRPGLAAGRNCVASSRSTETLAKLRVAFARELHHFARQITGR